MLSLPLQISVYDASTLTGNSGTLSSSTFGVLVQVGGEDYTDRLIGEVEVDAELEIEPEQHQPRHRYLLRQGRRAVRPAYSFCMLPIFFLFVCIPSVNALHFLQQSLRTQGPHPYIFLGRPKAHSLN